MRKRQSAPPIERFPLRPRADGRFQKRILGRLYYFGRDGNREQAIAEYREQADDLYAGRTPACKRTEPTAVIKDVFNLYLADKEGEISAGWYSHCKRTLKRFNAFLKRRGIINLGQLTPDVFSGYGAYLREKLGGYAYNHERSTIVGAFRHAEDQDWIEHAPKIGRGFRPVSIDRLRAQTTYHVFTADELKRILAAASVQLFAQIMLGLNCGMGLADCVGLKWSHLDLSIGICTEPRTKNGLPRMATLWPETASALNRIKRRDSGYVFCNAWGRRATDVQICQDFLRTRRAAGVNGDNIGFYDLRHTFATYADECGDETAWKRIMGHKLPGLKSVYVNAVAIERLKRVTDHVRSRLSIADYIGHAPGLTVDLGGQ